MDEVVQLEFMDQADETVIDLIDCEPSSPIPDTGDEVDLPRAGARDVVRFTVRSRRFYYAYPTSGASSRLHKIQFWCERT